MKAAVGISLALAAVGFVVSTACMAAIDREQATDDFIIPQWSIAVVILGAMPAAYLWTHLGGYVPRLYDVLYPHCSVDG